VIIPRKLLLAVIFALVGAGLASASTGPANIYFAQTAQGSNNGADCADAYAYNDGTNGINKSVNWVAGNVLHICGTIQLAAGKNFITAQASGSSGNPITIQFEAGSIFEEPYFGSNGSSGINLNGNNYITITSLATGSAGGGTLANYGTIQAYSNGTSGANSCTGPSVTTAPGSAACTSSVNGMSAIYAIGSNYVTLSNMNCSNMYVITSAESSGLQGAPGNDCIQAGGEGLTVNNNIMSYDGLPIDQTSPSCSSCSNSYIYGNYFSADGWAIGCAPGDLKNLWIHDNRFTDWLPWTYSGGGTHLNGIHCYDLSIGSSATSGGIQNFYLWNNLFDGDMGTSSWTTWVYLEADWGGCGSGYWGNTTSTAYVWNNVFAGSLDLPNARLDICAGTGHQVYNNTFYVGTTNSGRCFSLMGNGSATGTFYNNAFTGCDQNTYFVGMASVTADYNYYANYSGGNFYFDGLGTQTNVFSTWQKACSCDSHSAANASGTIGVNSLGLPSTGSALLLQGSNMMSTATGNFATLANSTTAGASVSSPEARPSGSCSSQGTSSCWDIGAYEISNGSSDPPPNPPTGLAASVSP
jgi:hypothetical protein